MAHPALIVPPSGPVTAHCFRLRPGDNLMPSLKQAASIILSRIPNQLCGSAFVITAVGSLQEVTLRLANASRTDGQDGNGENCIKRYPNKRFEIVSLTGTFSRDDGCHIHLSLSDAEGNTVGGHLIDGVVFTTVEVVLGTADGVKFVREMDKETGYKELEPRQLVSNGVGLSWGKMSMALFFVAAGFFAGRFKTR